MQKIDTKLIISQLCGIAVMENITPAQLDAVEQSIKLAEKVKEIECIYNYPVVQLLKLIHKSEVIDNDTNM